MKDKKCAIYSITNKENGRKYIGGTTDITIRWYQHKTHLNTNKHANKGLQEEWNKFGKNSFVFEIIEEVDETDLPEKEHSYIVNSENIYNLRRVIGGSEKQRKAYQRARDLKMLKSFGFNSIEGVLSALKNNLISIEWVKK